MGLSKFQLMIIQNTQSNNIGKHFINKFQIKNAKKNLKE